MIELRSNSDRLRTLRDKMGEWLANGAQLGWLIDPETRTVEIYRGGREPELLAGVESVAGEGPVRGFVLHLAPVWTRSPIEVLPSSAACLEGVLSDAADAGTFQ